MTLTTYDRTERQALEQKRKHNRPNPLVPESAAVMCNQRDRRQSYGFDGAEPFARHIPRCHGTPLPAAPYGTLEVSAYRCPSTGQCTSRSPFALTMVLHYVRTPLSTWILASVAYSPHDPRYFLSLFVHALGPASHCIPPGLSPCTTESPSSTVSTLAATFDRRRVVGCTSQSGH